MEIHVDNSTEFNKSAIRQCLHTVLRYLRSEAGTPEVATLNLSLAPRPKTKRFRYNHGTDHAGTHNVRIFLPSSIDTYQALGNVLVWAIGHSLYPNLKSGSQQRLWDKFKHPLENKKLPKPAPRKKRKASRPNIEARYRGAQARVGAAQTRLGDSEREARRVTGQIKRRKTELRKAQDNFRKIRQVLLKPVESSEDLTDDQLAVRIRATRQLRGG